MNAAWGARFKRIHMLLHNRFRNWNDCNINMLRTLQNKLTPENREILERFDKARNSGLILRLFHVKRNSVYRQTVFDNLGLIAAAILGKI